MGACSVPPGPIAGFKEPTSKGEEGKQRDLQERRDVKGREEGWLKDGREEGMGRRRGRGREGKGKGEGSENERGRRAKAFRQIKIYDYTPGV